MPRYIDADALIDEMKKEDTYQNRLFRKTIEKQPTVSPDEARGVGKWLWEGFNIVCSKCDFQPFFDSTEPLYKFCPNCGAKMEVSEDG